MPIWLKGVGRSNAELARLLAESNGGRDTCLRYRRCNARHELHHAHGELIYLNSRIPCQALEISAEGCSLQTEKPFRAGALAPVEVVLPISGLVLHIGGVTQWVKKERQLGVRFTHVDTGSKDQLELLVDCLLGRKSVESVKESIGDRRLNPIIGDVLAVEAPEVKPPSADVTRAAASDLPSGYQGKLPYDRSVHGGEGRLCAYREGDWPVHFQSPDRSISLTGAIVDLSLGGCTIRTARPFAVETYDPLEVRFEMRGQEFLFSGVARSIYGPHSLGIQFNPMSRQKRGGLALLLVELCAATRTQLDVG